MTDIIRTNTDSLQKTQEQLMQELNAIKDAISEITGDINLLNASWQGSAHTAFVQNIHEDLAFLGEACDGIDAIIKYEGKAIAEYNQCENKVAQLIEQIKV